MRVKIAVLILVAAFHQATTTEEKISSNLTAADTDDTIIPLGYHNSTNLLGKRERQKRIRYLVRSKSGKWEELARSGSSNASSQSRWDPNAKVKMIIHGFSPPNYAKAEDVPRKMNILKIGEAYYGAAAGGITYNVVVVDWTSLSIEPFYKYYEAALSTVYAGEDVAQFLIKQKSLGLISAWDDVHIVGVSLGAHVAGVVGAIIKQSSGGLKLGRITGIDPAGPLFDNNYAHFYGNKTRALRKSDANFVDVIHCNMGTLLSYGFARGRFGSAVQSGHADFYPDGGESQRKCSELRDQLEYCSHSKCPLYFAQSISQYFLSCPCQSWDEFRGGNKCSCSRNDGSEMAMGEQCSTRARGKYYLFM